MPLVHDDLGCLVSISPQRPQEWLDALLDIVPAQQAVDGGDVPPPVQSASPRMPVAPRKDCRAEIITRCWPDKRRQALSLAAEFPRLSVDQILSAVRFWGHNPGLLRRHAASMEAR